MILPRLKPIPIKERNSVLFLEKGHLDVQNGAFVVIDKNGVRTHIPVGGTVCLMLEPGSRVSHRAVELASRAGCLIIWVGEAGVRLYSAGQPGGARADKLLFQAKLALDPKSRLNIVREMFRYRFKDEPPRNRSIQQLRGIEGVRTRKLYNLLANRYGAKWSGRQYNQKNWEEGDIVNRCLSSATSCLYGITEAAILAAGYAPAIGFLHSGDPRSFVFDIADLFKFETVVPVAFKVAATNKHQPEREVRLGCRDIFRRTKLLKEIIPTIEKILAVGGEKMPDTPEYTIKPVIKREGISNDGHRD